MRILAWILLLVGVGLAAAGAARNGDDLSDHRATMGSLAMLEHAQSSLDAAHQAQATAAQAARVTPGPDADAALIEATTAVHAARDEIATLRQVGALDGSLPTAIQEARAAHAAEPLPGPGERLMGWLQVGGVWWAIGVVLVGAGAFMERRRVAKRSTDVKPGEAGSVDFPGSVRQILDEIASIGREIADLEMDGPSVVVRERIDILQDDVITPVVDGRGQLMARHGTSRFAVYFGAFSAGERNLARVWSALTDGHSVVARQSLVTSRAAFQEALEAWERAEQEA